jgi:L-alanine-DL-glutamate epimerase-like enolase superfamily enzyme
MLVDPVDAKDGWFTLTEKPGLGIELDEERLKATKIG